MSDITTLMMAAAGVGGAEETDANFNQTVLLLHGDGTNGAQNNTFLDSSSNNFTITRNGNTTQGRFSPFSDGWSNYFAGDDSSVQFASQASYGVGTGNFTVELWANFSTLRTSTGHNRIYAQSVSGTDGIVIDYVNDGIQVGIQNTYPINVYSWVPEIGRWYHIAVVRSGTSTNQVALYIDGVSVATGTSAGNVAANNINIGSINWATSWGFNGYVSNVRFSNTARTISVPTGPYSDDANTLFLSCQSNRFVDNATPANTSITTFATAPKVTPFSPFAPTAAYDPAVNGGSGYFDGTGDTLDFPNNAAFAFGAGAFTIQFWIYAPLNNDKFILEGRNAIGTMHITTGGASSTTAGVLRYVGSSTIVSSNVITDNSWHHCAIVRDGSNNITLYVDGVSRGTGTDTTNYTTTTGTFDGIGGRTGVGNYLTGYLSGLQILKGTAIDFSSTGIPTAPPTNVANTSLLLNFTNAGIFDNTGKNNLETVGNAQIDTTTKKFGTGSMEFDGTGDYLVRPYSENFSFGSGDFTVECFVNTTQSSGYPSVVGRWNNSLGWSWDLRATSADNSGKPVFAYNNGTSNVIISSTGSTIYDGNWHHLCVVRNGSTITLYVDGTSVGSGSFSGTINAATSTPFYVGYNDTNSYAGFIDDLRITKGVARYTSNFTVPDKAFPDL